jgi:enoyl-CoA hydratase/carnithine racemase
MRNAVSLAMWTAIGEQMQALAKDDACAGDRHPRRGHGRLRLRRPTSPSSRKTARTRRPALHYNKQTELAYSSLRHCPKPTVAMIFGYCMGGADGAGRWPATSASPPRARSSASPPRGSSIIYGLDPVAQLVDLVGPAVRQGHPVLGAHGGGGRGAAHRLHPAPGARRPARRAHARVSRQGREQCAAVHPRHQGPGARHLRGHHRSHRAELAELGLETFNSQDYKEGTSAFLEKRAPRFQGR